VYQRESQNIRVIEHRYQDFNDGTVNVTEPALPNSRRVIMIELIARRLVCQ